MAHVAPWIPGATAIRGGEQFYKKSVGEEGSAQRPLWVEGWFMEAGQRDPWQWRSRC